MAGFLGMKKPNIAVGVVPPKPTAPSIKPVSVPAKPAVAGAKPAIKPVGIKPPVAPKAIAPKTKEVEVVEEVKEEVKEVETVEEAVTLAPTPVEAVVETEEIKVRPIGSEKEVGEISVTHSPEEEVVAEEETKEEELSPQQRAAITRKKNAENKKRKEAVEQLKEDVATGNITEDNKKVVVDSNYIPEAVPERSTVNYDEVIASTIIYSAGSEWDKQVAELTSELKGIVIEPDMNTATMKQAMSDLVGLKDTIFLEYTLNKSILEATNRKIDMIKGLNAKGSSADERKLNSLKAVVNHQEGGLTINLIELLDVVTAKFNFYDGLMKQIEFKAKSLITMNGALKLEKDALGTHV